MAPRAHPRLAALRARLSGSRPPISAEQAAARSRWQDAWTLPILLAAVVPLFTTPSGGRDVAQWVIGLGSWLVFVVDLVVQRHIVPDYLRRLDGRIDLAIVLMTFPYYLIPQIGDATALLLFARLARVVRVLVATKGLRRFTARLGKVVAWAGLTVLACVVVAYGAEHPENPEFATFGDALWWGIVTFTTVGYGDIVPETTAGRVAGIGIMLTGIAVLGILAGSLASLFGLDRATDEAAPPPAAGHPPASVHEELQALSAELEAVQARLAEIAARTGGGAP